MRFTRHNLASILVIVLLLGGAAVLGRGLQEWHEYRHWATDVPLDIEVDCSKPGTYETVLNQTCPRAQLALVGLKLPKAAFDLLSPLGVNVLLRGLQAKLSLHDIETGELITEADSKIVEGLETWSGLMPVFQLNPFPKGRYQAILTISDGAKGLNRIPQRLQARYLLSGRELRPAGHRIVAGSIAIVAAVALWISIWLVGLIRRIQTRAASDKAPPTTPEPADTP